MKLASRSAKRRASAARAPAAPSRGRRSRGIAATMPIPSSATIPEDGTLGPPRSGKGESMRPFEGIKILDCTHVLAGPFAAYQLAVLGADVIKVDDPNEPDQSRESGADHTLNKALM